MIIRRSISAGRQAPSLHDFRRAFALAMLREGVDVYTLAMLRGHSTIDVLKYYLKQTTEDMAIAHSQHGPVDNLGFQRLIALGNIEATRQRYHRQVIHRAFIEYLDQGLLSK